MGILPFVNVYRVDDEPRPFFFVALNKDDAREYTRHNNYSSHKQVSNELYISDSVIKIMSEYDLSELTSQVVIPGIGMYRISDDSPSIKDYVRYTTAKHPADALEAIIYPTTHVHPIYHVEQCSIGTNYTTQAIGRVVESLKKYMKEG